MLNGKVYIGRTMQGLSVRFKQHVKGMGYGKKMPIHLAISKYNKENFTIEEIFCCLDEEIAGYAELYFINQYRSLVPNGYNVDLNTKFLKDNPYLIKDNKGSLAVQSIEGETVNSEYNPSKRTRYPVELWKEIKFLYESGKSPKHINKILKLNIPHRTMITKLKDLGCDTSCKSRNVIRGNGKYLISAKEKIAIIEDFKNKMTIKQLEEKYKRASRPIRAILVEAGLCVSRDKKICRPVPENRK